MAKGNSISVPCSVSGRYRKDEQVKHELLRSANGVCLWKSTHKRDHLNLPVSVRYHVTDDGQATVLLMAEADRALANYNHVLGNKVHQRTFHVVAYDEKDGQGRNIRGIPLSRQIDKRSTLKRVHRRLLRAYPDAYPMTVVSLC